MTLIKFEVLILFLLALIFSRFYNLEETSRFLWDESGDLVGIHQYWVEKKLSIVGPTSQDGTEVLSSLTYYLLMPAAVLGKFSPDSIQYGAAVFGVATAILVMMLVWTINKRLYWYVGLLVIFWYPLVETGRWAWNTNFIPFWAFLGLFFFFKKTQWSLILSGLFLGLTIHHHFLSAFSLAGFNLALSFWIIKKREKIYGLLFLGEFLAVLPFTLFDLFHPPGLFLTQILYFNHTNSIGNFIYSPQNYFYNMLNYFTQNNVLAWVLGGVTLILAYKDIKAKSFSLILAAGWVFQVLLLPFIKDPFYHYHMPSIAFFLTWLIYPRNIGVKLAKFCLIILVVGSLFSFYLQITKKSWETDKKLVLSVADIIEKEVENSNLESVNIATLESPDINTTAQRYRDILMLRDFYLDDRFSYFDSRYLFVISTSGEDKIRKTISPEFREFRGAMLTNTWSTSNPDWKIYLFKKVLDK